MKWSLFLRIVLWKIFYDSEDKNYIVGKIYDSDNKNSIVEMIFSFQNCSDLL